MLSAEKSKELWEKALKKGRGEISGAIEQYREGIDGYLKVSSDDLYETIHNHSKWVMESLGKIMLSENDLPSYYESAELDVYTFENQDKEYPILKYPINVFIDHYNQDRSYTIRPNHHMSSKIKREYDDLKEKYDGMTKEVTDLSKPALPTFVGGLIRMLIAPGLLFMNLYLDALTHSSETNGMTFIKILCIVGFFVTIPLTVRGFGTVSNVLSTNNSAKKETLDKYEMMGVELKGLYQRYKLAEDFENAWFEAEKARRKRTGIIE